MYGNVDAALLWLILLAEYVINEWNPKRIKNDSCIFFWKDEKGNLELVMLVHVDDAFLGGKPEMLKVIKEKIKEKFNI